MFDSERSELIDRAQEPVVQLATGDRETVERLAVAELLGSMALADRVEAQIVRVAGQWDEAKAWKDDGALSAASWLAHGPR